MALHIRSQDAWGFTLREYIAVESALYASRGKRKPSITSARDVHKLKEHIKSLGVKV